MNIFKRIFRDNAPAVEETPERRPFVSSLLENIASNVPDFGIVQIENGYLLVATGRNTIGMRPRIIHCGDVVEVSEALVRLAAAERLGQMSDSEASVATPKQMSLF